MGKSAGKVEIIMGMFALSMVVIAMFFVWKLSHFMITGAYVEDALAASNLASALIDVEEYGKSYTVCIPDPEAAFEVYHQALSVNLQLDENGNSYQKELLEGPVRILSYIVYNVKNDLVECYALDGEGRLTDTHMGAIGTIYTPDGVLVETTTIYSKVEFGVRGIGNQTIIVRKEKSADIMKGMSD